MESKEEALEAERMRLEAVSNFLKHFFKKISILFVKGEAVRAGAEGEI